MRVPLYLIWSEEHRSWWRPARCGYTNRISEAGRYSAAEAEAIVRDANFGDTFNEIAIPVPDRLDDLIERAKL